MNLWEWWKCRTFGGKILRDMGSVQGESSRLTSMKLKVYELEPKPASPGQRISLQIIFKAPLAYQNMPIVLSQDEARKLIDVLQAALRK